jgi:hypothetical protein
MPCYFLSLVIFLFLFIDLAGCVHSVPSPPVQPGTPLGLQMLRTEAQMQKYPFRILQQFEQSVDLAFIDVDGPPSQLDAIRAHTGHSSVLIAKGAKSLSVRLASLLSGAKWPDQWTLVGAYFYTRQAQRLVASYETDGAAVLKYSVELPAERWTPVLLDIASLQGSNSSKIGAFKFTFESQLLENLWCDDVLLINNSEIHVENKDWKISEQGFQYCVERPNVFTITLKTPEADRQGWRLTEANSIRACFDSRGNHKQQLIYSGGWMLTDGEFQSLIPAGELRSIQATQHKTPGTISIAPEAGRLDRNSSGDADNDGYSEQTGTYRLIAAAGRIEFAIAPASNGQLALPVIEIAGLPPGPILATMEGRLIEHVNRLKNDSIIVELPGILSRPVNIQIRIGQ